MKNNKLLFTYKSIPNLQAFTFEPVIKWTGSKRSQATNKISYFPKQIDTYYEPFIGGGSVMRRLLTTTDISAKHFVCSDLNNDLITLWNIIKTNPMK